MGVSLGLRLLVIMLCIAFFVFTVRQIKSQKLLIKYSLLWFALSLVILLVALFPDPVFRLARMLGFDVASNFVFAAGFFFVLVVCLTQTRAISKQIMKNKQVVQRVALLEKQLQQADSNSLSIEAGTTEKH